MVSLRELRKYDKYLNRVISFHSPFNINSCGCCDGSYVKYAQIADILIGSDEDTYVIIVPIMKDRFTHRHGKMDVRYPIEKFLTLGKILDDSIVDILYANGI